MSEMTMIERVAKAIHASRLCQPADGPWRSEKSLSERFCMEAARAAIEAMRGIPDALTVTGGIAIEESIFNSDDELVFDAARRCHHAIIDAILNEPNHIPDTGKKVSP